MVGELLNGSSQTLEDSKELREKGVNNLFQNNIPCTGNKLLTAADV